MGKKIKIILIKYLFKDLLENFVITSTNTRIVYYMLIFCNFLFINLKVTIKIKE